MKKLRYLFTMLVCAFTLGTAQAAGDDVYDIGKQVTSVADAAKNGTKVLLQSPSGSSWNAGKFISPKGFTETATSANVYVFEATGQEVDGLPTYRLKNVAIGKYLRAEVYGKNEDTSAGVADPEAPGVLHAYTTDVSLAYTFTAVQPTAANSDNRREKVDEKNFFEGSWVFAENKEQPDGMGIGYFGTYYSGFMSIYTDTNAWYVYEAKKLTGADRLAVYLQSILPNGLNLYSEGSTIGHVPSNLYQALKAAYDKAVELTNRESTDEECDAAKEALGAAKAAADKGIIGLQNGKYYFFKSLQNGEPWAYANATGVHGTTGYKIPEAATATSADAAYIWKAVAVTDSTFALQNYALGTYSGENSTTSAQIPMSATPVALNVVYNTTNEKNAPLLFNIYNDVCMYHIDGSGNLVRWQSKDGGGCLFQFEECSDDLVQALESQVKQAQLNEVLKPLFEKASGTYNKGRHFTMEGGTLDGTFDEPGLVTDADHLSSNATEPSEGSIAALVDGDFTSYFHSVWSGSNDNAPKTYHYIQADLGKAISTLAIKYAKRAQNQKNFNPTNFFVYATNDTTSGKWDLIGSYPLTYDYTSMVGETEASNFAGVRGIELGKPYQFVRLACTEHQISGGLKNGFPYFYLSELRFYPATYDAASSKAFEQVKPEVAKALADALAKAVTEVSTEKATQATIDELTAAYKAFAAQFPDPQVLTDSIAEAKTFAAYPVGEELGYYTQEGVDALNNAITEVEGTVADGMTLDEINAGIAKLRDAVKAFKATLILPEAGKVYVLRGMTTDANNQRALGAIIYSTGNSTTGNLKSQAKDADGNDPVAPEASLNYLWKAVSVNGSNIVLQNLGTGFYMGKQDKLNGAITNVPEPTEIGIQGISTGGGFNLIVGNNRYVNFQGAGPNMVAWESAVGTDNSSIKFEEAQSIDGTFNWGVKADAYQIITLPVAIMTPNDDNGTAYTVLGQKETDGKFTLELKKISDAEIPAGTPFVYKANAEVQTAQFVLVDETYENLTYAATGTTTENGALTGVIAQQSVDGAGKVIIRNGAPVIIGNNSSADDRAVAANTGYINYVTTTETGDAQIALTESMTTGITGTTTTDANATVDVYTVAGIRVRANVKAANATNGLPAGIYVVGGKKVIVK